MAITTYAELQAAAAYWLIRADLTARIVEFIALAEARLNRIMRGRQEETESALTSTSGSRVVSLPSTYGEALVCWIVIDGERRKLEYADPLIVDATAVQGEPVYWGIDGSNLAFERPCDQAYSLILRYFAKFALSEAAPTNWLLTSHPDIYLFATLSEAAPFLRDADLAAAYEAKLGRAIGEANFKEGRARSLQPLRTEPAQLLVAGSTGAFNIATGV